MSVLLIRLAAPMQSWGANSRFSRRETEMMPTKSGVIGLIAAALGMGRRESLQRFEGLRFGVRTDQAGTIMSDYHTAQHESWKNPKLSQRFYLQDAVFLAGLESKNQTELLEYENALHSPYYQLFLGRRSCPPDGPIWCSIVKESLELALQEAPWQATQRHMNWASRTRQHFPERSEAEIIIEPSAESAKQDFIDSLNDEPISYDMRHRQWRSRGIVRLPKTVVFNTKNSAPSLVQQTISPDVEALSSAGSEDGFLRAVAQVENEES
ncbi:type I-E CRISPR-associated protein Cas5/CasD [Bifidobacterium psychraerophilum]|uniref:type I-E CRISPR-associated protein Cas5/CasD n=1 Tax=Bifidobacterium psychraerophilum TaxID=218140 RepID=UPI0039E9A95B